MRRTRMAAVGMLWVAALLGTVLPTTAWAKNSYKISVRLKVNDAVGVYHAQGQAVTLDQVSGRRETQTTIRGEGVFSQLNKDKRGVDEEVVGIDYKGHSRISLENENGRTFLHTDLLLEDKIDGTPLRMENNYKAEVRFLQGSWADYVAGGNVTMQLTEEGQKTAIEAGSARLRQALQGIKEALSGQLAGAGAEFGPLTVDSWKADTQTIVRGNKNRLAVESARSEIEMSFIVLADF